MYMKFGINSTKCKYFLIFPLKRLEHSYKEFSLPMAAFFDDVILEVSSVMRGQEPHPVNYVYHKKLLNENESYFVLVARHILLVMISNVY